MGSIKEVIMPTFTDDQATQYDSRITRLVPGYELLHQLTNAQLQATLKDNAQYFSGRGGDWQRGN